MTTTTTTTTMRAPRVAFCVVLVSLMILPVFVAFVALAGRSWVPVGDFAITDLRVRDVWSWDTPLTGPWSRLGWNHPGPVMFWLRWPLSAISGGEPWATRVSGAVVEGLALGWLALVTWRRGVRMLLAATTVTVLTYVALGSSLVHQPWDPNVVVPWFVLFLFLTLLTATGSFHQLIAMTVAGTVLVQTQVGYALLVLVGFAWVLTLVGLDARRSGLPQRWRRIVAISAGIGLVLWSFPLIDLAVNWPGNLGALAVYFTDRGHATIGLVEALGQMAAEFRWLPPWLGAPVHVDPVTFAPLPSTGWLLLVPLGAAFLALLAPDRREALHDRRWIGLAVVMLLVGVLSISNADELRFYAFQWRSALAAFVAVTCVWTIAAAVQTHVPTVIRMVVAAGVTLVVAWSAVGAAVDVATAESYRGLEANGPLVERLMEQARTQLPGPDETVLVHNDVEGNAFLGGFVDALDREGVDVRVGHERGRVFGSHRTVEEADATVVWDIRDRGSRGRDPLAEPGARVVARSALDPAESAELTRLQVRLAKQLRRAGRTDLLGSLDSSLVAFAVDGVPGVDAEAAARAGALNEKVARSDDCQCVVVAIPQLADR